MSREVNTEGDGAPEARVIVGDFECAPRRAFQNDRHYLLYAAAGAMRIEADGRVWSLPPARAAWIAAGKEVHVTLTQPMSACSILYSPGFIPAPARPLAVVELSPLARELLLECRALASTSPLEPYARTIFATLAAVVERLTADPSRAWLPVARSAELTRALALTEAQLAEAPVFRSVAAACGLSPRSLARRFRSEMGMTWRQVLRRLRMLQAVEALARADERITDVALACGYVSVSAFNAAFLDFTGQTPTAYRAAIRPLREGVGDDEAL
ncbi:MAG: AraC family transcriptional regulator [Nannocystaceae bacterium]|nr:AraC family transcriptional regulator [Nannocystaceae bacterium]